jgi:phosphohistidine phosphatase
MKSLFLVRHAHAADEPDDHERGLTPHGVRAATQAGTYLAAAHCEPQVALLSTAARVTQTWQHIERELSATPKVEAEPELYLADLASMCSRVISIADSVDCALLVAHNPGVTELANWLTAAGPSDLLDRLHRGFAPAAVASLRLRVPAWSEISERCAEIRGYWD